MVNGRAIAELLKLMCSSDVDDCRIIGSANPGSFSWFSTEYYLTKTAVERVVVGELSGVGDHRIASGRVDGQEA